MPSFRLPDQARDFGKKQLRTLFNVGQRVGVDVLPRHFYSSIPDVFDLRRHDYWKHPRSMVGISGATVHEQLQLLRECSSPQWQGLQRERRIHAEACESNGVHGFGEIESDFLFSFIATKQPKRVVQVGAGVSTAVVLAAAEEAGYGLDLLAIDPYPTPYLRKASAEHRITLIADRAQNVPLSTLTGPQAPDLLFVDSTHTVKVGSEVNWIILEVLPRLPAGTFVHFHDIFFPYDYQRDLQSSVFFWSESSLLHAFLIGNSRYTLRLSMSMLHYQCPNELRNCLPNYRPQRDEHGLMDARHPDGHFPSSAYLQRL